MPHTGAARVRLALLVGAVLLLGGTAPPLAPADTEVTHVLITSACGNGSVSGSSGAYAAGAPVTVSAIPAPGYWFDGWSVGSCGGTVVSRQSDYTFPMPGMDCDLHANFVRSELIETFESYATGGVSFDSLDKNDPAGPNQAANGFGNPWWGPNPPNGRIHMSITHTGSQSLRGTAGNCRDIYNLAYRHGGGRPFAGGVYLDWWFYDPLGPGGTTTNFCGDHTALTFYAGLPSDTDHPDPVRSGLDGLVQQLAIGMSDCITTHCDLTKYQVRIIGDTAGYGNGWLNTSLTRSVGWHHARVVVGPPKSPSGTNDVTFYIDDMANPVVGPRDSVTRAGYNSIQVNTIMPAAGSCASGTGCRYSWPYHYSAIDDISFGALPGEPLPVACGMVGTDRIDWRWVGTGCGADGFEVWDAASGGTPAATADGGASAALEAGLTANTRYTRWVSSYVERYAGEFRSSRVALPPVCTLPLPPVYGVSGDCAISCNNGRGGTQTYYPTGAATTFASANGFGEGPSRADSYSYIWNNTEEEPADWEIGATLWTSGVLSLTPNAPGSYYLHLRSRNADSTMNTATLTLGPYVYVAAAPVERIGDAWGCDDGVPLVLSGKVVTAAYEGSSFWIEETDRTAGMLVSYSATLGSWRDRLVAVVGVLDSSTRPRRLLAGSVVDLGAAPAIGPLGMVLRNLGGSDLDPMTPGVANGLGVYNIGLLVRVAGSVSFCDNSAPSNRFFYVSDGSRLAANDGSGHAGIKVKCGTTAAPASGMVVVTGVVSVEPSPNGWAPVIITRGEEDVRRCTGSSVPTRTF